MYIADGRKLVKIRNAVPEDNDMIVKLIKDLNGSEDVRYFLLTSDVEKYLDQPDARILLAEENGISVGMISFFIRFNLFHAGRVCQIEELVVKEEVQGRGIGGKLLEEVIKIARDQRCAEISVSTMFTNKRAISFYKNHGLIDEALLLEKHFS
jgi:ribosomal protein S18 acetylase RimI-like enzyme